MSGGGSLLSLDVSWTKESDLTEYLKIWDQLAEPDETSDLPDIMLWIDSSANTRMQFHVIDDSSPALVTDGLPITNGMWVIVTPTQGTGAQAGLSDIVTACFVVREDS
jgi:hypothetical protein